jgi:hypothetical protein
MSLAIDKKQGSGVGHTLNASFMSLALLTNKQGSGVGHTLNASLALGWPLPGVHTLAAMGLLWALEKGYYAAHV